MSQKQNLWHFSHLLGDEELNKLCFMTVQEIWSSIITKKPRWLPVLIIFLVILDLTMSGVIFSQFMPIYGMVWLKIDVVLAIHSYIINTRITRSSKSIWLSFLGQDKDNILKSGWKVSIFVIFQSILTKFTHGMCD